MESGVDGAVSLSFLVTETFFFFSWKLKSDSVYHQCTHQQHAAHQVNAYFGTLQRLLRLPLARPLVLLAPLLLLLVLRVQYALRSFELIEFLWSELGF